MKLKVQLMILLKWFVAKIGKFGAWLLWSCPYFFRRGLGVLLGTLWFDVFRIRRSLVVENIQRAFPHMSEKEALKMGRRSLWNLGTHFTEYSFLPFLSSRNLSRVATAQGLEHLDQALEEKKGVLMLTLHLGHGDLGVAALSLMGYPMVLVSKFFKLKWLNDLWFGMRERLGTEFIPPRDSSFQLLKKLKGNKVVVIPLDQFTGPPIGVKTKFFGVETGTAAGLALMAFRSGARVIPACTYRTAQHRHHIQIFPAVDMSVYKDLEEPSVMATEHFNRLLEKMIEDHPDEWMWIHRRWKKFVVT